MKSRISSVALFLSIIGAAVDFSSGTIMLQNAMVTSKNVIGNVISIDGVVWGLLLYGLATLLTMTGVLGITRIGEGRMRIFGGLTSFYGVVMLIVGSAMFAGFTPIIQDIFAPTLAMFAVGLGMLLNGMIMMIGNQSLMVKQEM